MAGTVRLGSKGQVVRHLQHLLNQELQPSPMLPEDGDFGKLTLAAVQAFQEQHHLNRDGVVGPLTWEELERQTTNKYLVTFSGWSVVPSSLRDFVKETVTEAFSSFDLDLDFPGNRKPRDLKVTFSNELHNTTYGEGSRPDLLGVTESGEATIWVGVMRAMRLQLGPNQCEVMFPETTKMLGSLIANTTVHEIAHMLGLSTGGFDDGGHVSDPDNYLWMRSPREDVMLVSPYFDYTVKAGDTLSGIVARYKSWQLNPCLVGSSNKTYMNIWEDPANKRPGYVADPQKWQIPGRCANDPNSIYPGEKVALPNWNLRKQGYRQYFRGYLGPKSFTQEQVDTMRRFIAERLAAGKG